MDAAERIIRGAYDLGALGSTPAGAPFYAARGWLRWLGPCSALTPEGIIAMPEEEGSIYALPVTVPLDVSGELTCD
jgi:aminoglycoside 2'-N-acetyltransferase I